MPAQGNPGLFTPVARDAPQRAYPPVFNRKIEGRRRCGRTVKGCVGQRARAMYCPALPVLQKQDNFWNRRTPELFFRRCVIHFPLSIHQRAPLTCYHFPCVENILLGTFCAPGHYVSSRHGKCEAPSEERTVAAEWKKPHAPFAGEKATVWADPQPYQSRRAQQFSCKPLGGGW